MLKKHITLAILISLAMSTTAQSEIYQWQDENGRVHFGDKKKPHTQQKKIQIQSVNQVGLEDYKKNDDIRKVVQDAERAKEQQREQRQLQEQQQHAKRQARLKSLESCFIAYKNLTVLQQQIPAFSFTEGQFNPRGMYIPTNSTPHYINDEERTSAIQTNEAIANKNCTKESHIKARNTANLHWQIQMLCSNAKRRLDSTAKKSDQFPGKEYEQRLAHMKKMCDKKISILPEAKTN